VKANSSWTVAHVKVEVDKRFHTGLCLEVKRGNEEFPDNAFIRDLNIDVDDVLDIHICSAPSFPLKVTHLSSMFIPHARSDIR